MRTQDTIKMMRGRIMINNRELKPQINPPTAVDILKAKPEEMEEILAVKLMEGDEHEEENSEFFSYAQRVRSRSDVDKGYQKMRVKFADATHISCAFILKGESKSSGFVDDGEIGQGRNILSAINTKQMVNICVYVIRYYGGKHLGKRRFEIAKNLTYAAVRTFRMTRSVRNERLRRTQLNGSQISLASNISEASYISVDGAESVTSQEDTEVTLSTTKQKVQGENGLESARELTHRESEPDLPPSTPRRSNRKASSSQPGPPEK